jgi:hypothetical protein
MLYLNLLQLKMHPSNLAERRIYFLSSYDNKYVICLSINIRYSGRLKLRYVLIQDSIQCYMSSYT